MMMFLYKIRMFIFYELFKYHDMGYLFMIVIRVLYLEIECMVRKWYCQEKYTPWP